jgi:hypothetical protein
MSCPFVEMVVFMCSKIRSYVEQANHEPIDQMGAPKALGVVVSVVKTPGNSVPQFQRNQGKTGFEDANFALIAERMLM